MNDLIYTGTYKVYKIYRKSRRREVISKDLTRNEAIRLVNSYANSNTSMVVFDKQYSSLKYYSKPQ